MKKIIATAAALALAASLGTVSASACGGHHRRAYSGYAATGSCVYVDANYDGICDACGCWGSTHGTACYHSAAPCYGHHGYWHY